MRQMLPLGMFLIVTRFFKEAQEEEEFELVGPQRAADSPFDKNPTCD
ncbi:hypothetical protein I315_06746 [Cryptococcus gattii Ru294]|uniref:Uncharacterized protein n=2 Tax=Cryptococcus gattii TaxID=37769 RepID=E6QXT4_CRYGW|nr:Hypothetical Protein CGB_A4750C [Cryptococcus gattii WM276]KIR50804.1 hypothetical protein I315_06746 [Cryptococcus gattii Ru294]KIR79759.1 hypothetical protein I306_03220 [Cryptococcus gattii EJB2]KIY37052.1 hypothetical protein I305_00145 [Cryptococcus gattii E566]KJE02772.1 hypothetical protein I311_03516 [Cryptococcus gattii NT-10]ADV19641.1 Hypothetical Protein CGB_A4750C [Cryptococcus gattii WM276]